jgi:hypothetical protein
MLEIIDESERDKNFHIIYLKSIVGKLSCNPGILRAISTQVIKSFSKRLSRVQ